MVFTQFPLHPETPPEGKPRNMSGPSRVDAMLAQEGLPFTERKFSYNSRLSQELAKWAEREGRGDAFNDAVFRAYFVDAANIGEPEGLLQLVEEAGLPVERLAGSCPIEPFSRPSTTTGSVAILSACRPSPPTCPKGWPSSAQSPTTGWSGSSPRRAPPD